MWVVTVIGALQKVYIPYRSPIEALYALNSRPVVSFNLPPGFLSVAGMYLGLEGVHA